MHAIIVAATLVFATAAVVSLALPEPDIEVDDEARRLFDQPLLGFEDVCEVEGDVRIRHVRFATLDSAGRVEDRLELRTTTRTQGSAPVLEYLVDEVIVFSSASSGELRPTPAGLRLLRDEVRGAKILAAFAAAHPRVFAADVLAPEQSCGALRGKHEEKGKCAASAALGCVAKIPVVCLASLGVGYLCNYLIDKTCEENPDSCQPGWTTGE